MEERRREGAAVEETTRSEAPPPPCAALGMMESVAGCLMRVCEVIYALQDIWAGPTKKDGPQRHCTAYFQLSNGRWWHTCVFNFRKKIIHKNKSVPFFQINIVVPSSKRFFFFEVQGSRFNRPIR
jgi:hypothetical protein